MDSTGATGEKEKELVIVEWRDIIATSGWEQEITCPTIFTLGWLVSQDDNTITIANTVDFDDFTGDSRPPVYYTPFLLKEVGPRKTRGSLFIPEFMTVHGKAILQMLLIFA